MTYYTGIDVSLRSVSICVVNDKGEVCLEAKVAAEIDAIVECLHRFDREVRSVGFEAGTLTQYLTYGLQGAGFEVICLEARQVSVTLAAMRSAKTYGFARMKLRDQAVFDRGKDQLGTVPKPDVSVRGPRRRSARSIGDRAGALPAELSIDW